MASTFSSKWISVNERTAEIGLAKAIGATPGQILILYLAEAAVLSTSGGILGLIVGFSLSRLIHLTVPAGLYLLRGELGNQRISGEIVRLR